MADRNLLGRRLHEMRSSRGMTLRVLAERTDLGFQYLSELERGNGNPTLGTLERISEACGHVCEVTFEPSGQQLEPGDARFMDEFRSLLPHAPEEAKTALIAMLRSFVASRMVAGQ